MSLHDDEIRRLDGDTDDTYDRRRLLAKMLRLTVGGSLLGLVGGRIPGAAAAARFVASPVSNTSTRATKDTMTVAVVNAITTFNADRSAISSNGPLHVLTACYDCLTDVVEPVDFDAAKAAAAKGLKPTPKLAKSWKVSHDGKVWTFALQSNVKSQYGNTMTADDVVWSIDKYVAQKSTPGTLLGLAGITRTGMVKALNDQTVQITLDKQPPSYFLTVLSHGELGVYDSTEVKKHTTASDPWGMTWLDTNMAGYGPYTVASTSGGGTQVVLKARDDYWGKKPNIATLNVQTVPDDSARLSLLLGGQIDFAEALTALELQTVSKTAGLKVTRFTNPSVALLVMNNTVEPFNYKSVRRAVAMSVPYEQILKSVYLGTAQRWRGLIVPWFQGATEKYWKYETNYKAAKAAFADVNALPESPLRGTNNSLPTLNYSSVSPNGAAIALLVQQGLQKVGMSVNLQGLSATEFSSRRTAGTMAFYVLDNTLPAFPSALYNLQFWFATGSLQNLSRYQGTPKIDPIISKILTLQHGGPRVLNLLYDKAQKTLMNDIPMIPIAYIGVSDAHVASLHGFQSHLESPPRLQDLYYS